MNSQIVDDKVGFIRSKKHIGIFGRLIIGFSIVSLLFLISIGINLTSIAITKKYTEHVLQSDLPSYDTILDLNSALYNSYLLTQSLLLAVDAKKIDKLSKSWKEVSGLQDMIDQYSKTWPNLLIKEKWANIKIQIDKLKVVQKHVVTSVLSGDTAAASKIFNSDAIPIIETLTGLLNSKISYHGDPTGLLDLQSKDMSNGVNTIVDSLQNVRLIEYALFVIGIIASIIIALMTARSVLRHIKLFRQQSSRIASGDLRSYIDVDSNDEMGQLGNDLNKMTRSLADIANEITQSSHNMVSTLEEVRHAIDMQSSGASEQASSINEITASLSEIEKSTAQTMEKAQSLGQATERTREKGQLGLEAVDQSISGMNDIREKVQMIAQTILDLSHQTQQVGDITAVVKNLAQQSRMLALNASIEAAKAGEAGKGFSVVAVEVKNLAEQSEQATAQVQKILENIRQAAEKAVMVTEEGTKGVDRGTGLVEQTGEIIRNLNDVIYEAALSSQQIESAVRQESAGIEQITTGMNEINQVTASFVESVRQTTEAMGNLAVIAKNMKAYVDTYKL